MTGRHCPSCASAARRGHLWPRARTHDRGTGRQRRHSPVTQKITPASLATPGFAACVTTALRFVVTRARCFRTTEQPSEHLARFGAVRRPKASTRFHFVDNHCTAYAIVRFGGYVDACPFRSSSAMVECQLSEGADSRMSRNSTGMRTAVGQDQSFVTDTDHSSMMKSPLSYAGNEIARNSNPLSLFDIA